MPWFVYVARCGDGTLYTGVTTDPGRRQVAHNAGRGAAYTRARLPVRLVHLEPAAGRGAALRRELAIKRLSRAEKERMLAEKRSGEFRGFGGEALRFLRRLGRNNSREWFERHRPVYETELRQPMRELVEEMDVRLARLAPELIGDPRRSVFRIHRDVRFSADKSPYKTNVACQFCHHDAGRGAGQDAEGAGAGVYFQIAEGECFVAGGIWMPARQALEKLREAVADDPGSLDRIVRAPVFRRRFRELDREAMLTRLPRGYAEGHQAERWLRYKSFTATRLLSEAEVTGPRLPAILERDFAALLPLVRWLNQAIGYRAWERRYH
ncbi:MAG: TIGR02453 family protein [Gemmatimonadales bacterium]|nr:TIGR02453 family protein [Gemmatimonadales bacterium]